MEQKICIITGANSGIGKQAACLIAQQQVHVIMACRNLGRAEKACQDILSVDSSMSLEIMILDMADNISIKQFSERFAQKFDHLDILIHNAADFDISRKKPAYTPQGIESVWATNHLGPVMLTEALMPLLGKSTDGRIITISSKGLAMLPFTKVDTSDCEFRKRRYSVAKAYYQSKMAQEMYTVWLARQLKGTSVTANCIRVGAVEIDINRYPDLPGFLKKLYSMKKKLSISPKAMAEIYALLALENQFASSNGVIFDEHGKPLKALASKYSPPSIEDVMKITKTYLQGN
ncbi:MAG: SDR family NAD(P)-dependent oxidoreductase [Sphaerochaetaceae bacterium]|nr:SDR family NAD(P)-dependent oxidoreductase [Sphaerochaetaceae bacterium]